MGRKPRILNCGALYHIIQRGNNKNYIYEDILDKKMFFKLLIKAKDKFDFKVLYYVLMDNHYHMIVEAGETPISKAFQWFNMLYSKYYNKRYNRTGSIYGGRYNSTLISETRYYYQLIKYIAYNPVKAKIVNNACDYLWSAHISVLTGNKSVIDIDRMLSFFPGPKSKALNQYIELVEKEIEIRSDFGFDTNKEDQKIVNSLNYLLESLNYSDKVLKKIKLGDKSQNIKSERDEFIKVAYESGFTINEIARYTSFSYEGIRKILRGCSNL